MFLKACATCEGSRWGDVAIAFSFVSCVYPILVGMCIWSHCCKVIYAQQPQSFLGHRHKFRYRRLKNHNKFDFMVCGCKFVHLKASLRNVVVLVLT
jgi:hypothetical protein